MDASRLRLLGEFPLKLDMSSRGTGESGLGLSPGGAFALPVTARGVSSSSLALSRSTWCDGPTRPPVNWPVARSASVVPLAEAGSALASKSSSAAAAPLLLPCWRRRWRYISVPASTAARIRSATTVTTMAQIVVELPGDGSSGGGTLPREFTLTGVGTPPSTAMGGGGAAGVGGATKAEQSMMLRGWPVGAAPARPLNSTGPRASPNAASAAPQELAGSVSVSSSGPGSDPAASSTSMGTTTLPARGSPTRTCATSKPPGSADSMLRTLASTSERKAAVEPFTVTSSRERSGKVVSKRSVCFGSSGAGGSASGGSGSPGTTPRQPSESGPKRPGSCAN
mmetsp:Transcript_22485/g.58640  ORF Transcript_22485/g.58640 Transcript_22485/m.58640 type:complete len:339 (-) Transcript_22485:229-1245(-)